MSNLTHKTITKDYPENLNDGIMICGINFGYSTEDEALEKAGVVVESEPLSFFSDKAVNNTRFRNRVLTWLLSWGFELATQKGQEGVFERAFFQTNWLDTQTRSTTSDGRITTTTLVQESEGFLRMIEVRKPSVIIFVGRQVIEAFNDIRIRERVVSILGGRSGNAEVYQADLVGYKGRRFKLLTQKFGGTQIICLPHPSAWGLSNAYVTALKLKLPIDVLHKIIIKKP